MKIYSSERGQALIIIALAMIGLVSFSALAIDGGRVFSDRRHAQSAADSAVLAAALAKVKGQNYTTAATTIASTNGYNNDGTTNTVQVLNPPTSGTYAGNSQYIQVIIVSNLPTTFARVIGKHQMTSAVQAVARAVSPTTGSSSSGTGYGLTALKQSGTAISFTGSGDVNVQGGIGDNAAFSSTGSGDFNVDGNVQVSGSLTHTGSGDWNVGGNVWANGYSKTGSQNWVIDGSFFSDGTFSQTGSGDFTAGSFTTVGLATSVGSGTYPHSPYPAWPGTPSAYITPPVIADPFTSVLVPPTNPYSSCIASSSSGSTNRTLNPGCYSSINQTGSGDLTLNPGTYYMTGNFSMAGSGDLIANGVTFLFQAGSFSMSGSGDVTANGSMFYLKSGSFSMNGSGDIEISPMTSGDYKGLSIYMDRTNTSSYSMTGSGDSNFTGTLYAPASAVTLTGSGGTFVVDSQIICSTATLTGSGGLNLLYTPGNNYNPVQATPASIELVQ